MKNLFMKMGGFMVALAMILSYVSIPAQARAAGEKFIIDQPFRFDSTHVGALVYPLLSNGTTLTEQQITIPSTNWANEDAFTTDMKNGIASYFNSNGYSGVTSADIWMYTPSLATVAGSGLFADLVSKPTTLSGYGITDAAPSSRTISAGTGLSGGGDLSANRTISMPNIGTSGTYSSVTTDAQGRVTAGTNRSWNNTPGRSIVTGTGATGFQPSLTKDTIIKYGIKVMTTSTIAAGQEGYVALEIAPTNSSTAGDWINMGLSCGNGQSYSLAIALQGVQTTYCELSATVPAGYYAKLRSINVSGTPTYTYLGGQEMSF